MSITTTTTVTRSLVPATRSEEIVGGKFAHLLHEEVAREGVFGYAPAGERPVLLASFGTQSLSSYAVWVMPEGEIAITRLGKNGQGQGFDGMASLARMGDLRIVRRMYPLDGEQAWVLDWRMVGRTGRGGSTAITEARYHSVAARLWLHAEGVTCL